MHQNHDYKVDELDKFRINFASIARFISLDLYFSLKLRKWGGEEVLSRFIANLCIALVHKITLSSSSHDALENQMRPFIMDTKEGSGFANRLENVWNARNLLAKCQFVTG